MNQPRLIRNMLVGLPLGLFLLGGFSMIWHFRHPHESDKKPKNEAQSKPVDQADLEFNVTRLGMELANRPITDTVKTRQTASFIEGSLGINNIGYPLVTRNKFPYAGQDVSNLMVEIKGSRSPEEIILILANYDSAPAATGANSNGSGVAANLSLANLFLRTKPQRTLQFHFLANGLGAAPSGAEVVAQKFKALGSNIVAALVLDSLATARADAGTTPEVLWQGNEAAREMTPLAASFTANSTLRSRIMPANTPFGNATAQAFNQQGLPTIYVTTSQPANDDLGAPLDFAALAELVRGMGRALREIAQ